MQSATVRAALDEAEQKRQRERAKAKDRKKRRSGNSGWGDDEAAAGGGGGAGSRKKRGSGRGAAAAQDDSAAAAATEDGGERDFIAFSQFGDDSAQREMDDVALHQQLIVDQQHEEEEEAAAAAAKAAAAAAQAEEDEAEEEAVDEDAQMEDDEAAEEEEEAAAEDGAEDADEAEEEEALAASDDDEEEEDAAEEHGSEDEIAVDVVDPEEDDAAADDALADGEEADAMPSPLPDDGGALASYPATPAAHSRKRPSSSVAHAAVAPPSVRLSSFGFRADQVDFEAATGDYLVRFRAGERLVFRGSVAFQVEEGYVEVAGHSFGPRSSRPRPVAPASADGAHASVPVQQQGRTSRFHAHSWSWQPHALLSLYARAPASALQDEFVTTVRLSACQSRFAPQRLAQLVAAHAAGEPLSTPKPFERASAPTILSVDPYLSPAEAAAAAAAIAAAATPRKQTPASKRKAASNKKGKKGAAAAAAAAMEDEPAAAVAVEPSSFVQMHIPGFVPVLHSDDDFRAEEAEAAAGEDVFAPASAAAAAAAAAPAAPKSLYSALSVPSEWEETIKLMLQPALPANQGPRAAAAAAADEDDSSSPALSKSALLAQKLHQKSLRSAIQSGGLRILVYGARNTGKSTLLSLISNAALNRFEKVLLLDLDVGQSGLNPPGMIGLHEVDAPILSSGAAHVSVGRGALLGRMVWSHFVGDVAVGAADPLATLHAVREAVRIYETRYGPASPHTALCPLLVNSPGWLTGLGLELLQRSVRDIIKPVYLLETRVDKDDDAAAADDASAAGGSAAKKRRRSPHFEGEEERVLGRLDHPHQLYIMRRTVDASLAASVALAGTVGTAPRLRQLQLLAYFTAGTSPPQNYGPVSTGAAAAAALSPSPSIWSSSLPFCLSAYASLLSAQRPYRVPLASVRVEVLGLDPLSDYPPASALQLLNGSILGLCVAAPTAAERARAARDVVGQTSGLRLVRSAAPTPLFDPSAPAGAGVVSLAHCLGLGLVRGVDAAARVLYIVTPLSPTQMERVNLLQKGRMEAPQCAYGRDEYAQAAAVAAAKASGSSADLSSASLPYLSTSTLSASSGFGTKQMSSRHNLQRKRLQA